MATDRARNSYDPTRQYRSIVSQQGRVTVEADHNEAERIRAAESRAELVEIVGRTGTPDDGFKISVGAPATPLDFQVHAGTIYVGGVRIEAPEDFTYGAQPDWVDQPTKKALPEGAFEELVYLEVIEREVTAVEDPALREVALGGPDTAGRTRMQPRVMRTLSDGSCEVAFGRAIPKLYPHCTFVPDTMALQSKARLKVGFSKLPGADDPCLPIARSGFLGAENQLVRVQASSDNGLLWSWDNASFLYRGRVTGPHTVEIDGVPVDVFHIPKSGQWVEILEIAAHAGDASLSALVGDPHELAGYDPVTKMFDLRSNLNNPSRRDVYVRIWQERLDLPPDNATPRELSKTGVQIFVDKTPAPGDFWMIGLRPSTPEQVYPKRLGESFQPPDGPLRWVAPLATIAWDASHQKPTIHDCRQPFDPLTELTRTRCCELTIHPDDSVERIEREIQKRLELNKRLGISGLHIKFVSGVFRFARTVDIIGSGDLTVSGCGISTSLSAAKFEAVLAMKGWASVTVYDLTAHGGIPNTVGRNNHLNGALTFRSCGSVDVERVHATCASGKNRSATCITAIHEEKAPGLVRIRGCELIVGLRQTALLVINASRATIEDNQIRLPDRIKVGPVEPPADRDNLRNLMYENLRFVPAKTEALAELPPGMTEVAVPVMNGTEEIRLVTNENLADVWRNALSTITDYEASSPEIRRVARRRVDSVVESVASEAINDVRTRVLDVLYAKRPRRFAASQGIVVAGTRAGDIRILNNTISGVMEGIHVGFSDRNREERLRNLMLAEDLLITGNTVRITIPNGARGNHAAIFVGNVRHAAVRDNSVSIVDDDPVAIPKNPPDGGSELKRHFMRRTDGIRVWGFLGEKVAIEGNVTSHTRYPIMLRPLNKRPFHAGWWITRNVSVDALFAIQAPDANDPTSDIPGNT